ncbi:MAG: PAS domain S-box protein [Oligoflexales bacterium]|nr:PAS domain S-box protein [Oligoflexales bacterium]
MSQLLKNENLHQLASHNIRATHDILMDIEKSKESMESFVHEMPDIFLLMDKDGHVIRGNRILATIIGCNAETLYEENIRRLFTKETWNLFLEKLKQTESGGPDGVGVAFELPIDARSPFIDCLWHATYYSGVSTRRGTVFALIGRDVTELRANERKLAKVFAAVPLGIITINQKKQIEAPYSLYSEYLLQRKDLDGVDAHEAIFGRSWKDLTRVQQEGVKLIFNSLSDDEMWFDMSQAQFPKEIPVNEYDSTGQKSDTKWLSLTYNPIIHSGVVEKILIVLEDITERVKLREEKELRERREGKIARNFLDITSCDETLLRTSVSDIEHYMKRVTVLLEEPQIQGGQICNTYHAIKGVARTAGFTLLMDLVHNTEQIILRTMCENESEVTHICHDMHRKILEEWDEFTKICSIFIEGKKTKEIDSKQEWIPLSNLEYQLRFLVEKTSLSVSKKVNLSCEWNGINIPAWLRTEISEILIHLCNNAIDHGIETNQIRKLHQKPEEGQIKIHASQSVNILKFMVSDDGGGIDPEKIRKAAVDKNMMTEEVAGTLNESELFQLLLKSSFSMAEKVTEISGRGIGLDAVNERVRILGGTAGVKIESVVGKGSIFTFEINSDIKPKK